MDAQQYRARDRNRALAMVEAAFVCDAATTGLHWIYSPRKIAALVHASSSHNPEFFVPHSSPFYSASPGGRTPYGDELHAMLRGMAAADDDAAAAAGEEAVVAAGARRGKGAGEIGHGHQSGDGVARDPVPAAYARAFLQYARGGCAMDTGCPPGWGRLNGLTKAFLACMSHTSLAAPRHAPGAAGPPRVASAALGDLDVAAIRGGRWRNCPPPAERSSNNQAHAVVKAVAIAARYAHAGGGSGDQAVLLWRAEQAIRLLQDNADAVQFGVAAASLLGTLLRGVPLLAALHRLAGDDNNLPPLRGTGTLQAGARSAVSGVLADVERTVSNWGGRCTASAATALHVAAVQRLGSACELPGMFLSSVHGLALAAACGPPLDLAAAVRTTIMAGGDQASRSIFMGAALAAAGAAVPLLWKQRAKQLSGSMALARVIVPPAVGAVP